MRAVIQRVKNAQVAVEGSVVGQIGKGALILLGISKDDAQNDLDYLVDKVFNLRIFEDAAGKMNLSCAEAGGQFLVVSQFTLYGDCRKGRRPSFDRAAEPKTAENFYNDFVEALRKQNSKVETGKFKAMMDVSLVNDGPVTFILDSKDA